MIKNTISQVSPGSYKRGFTIIELLVVISIIGMLSSVVLASLSQVREKGNIGAGMLFAGNQYHAMGSDEYVRYTFDEGDFLSWEEISRLGFDSNYRYVKDSSGNNRYGKTAGRDSQDTGCYYCGFNSISTPSGKGSAYDFNSGYEYGYGHGVEESNMGWLEVRNIKPSVPSNRDFTISLWVNPYTINMDTGLNRSTNYIWYGEIATNNNNWSWPHLEVEYDSNDNESLRFSNTEYAYTLKRNAWTHLSVSYKYNSSAGSYSANLYINGKLVTTGIQGVENLGNITNIDLCIGSDWSYKGFNGMIDDFNMYSHAMSVAEIEKVYAEGLKTHEVADAK